MEQGEHGGVLLVEDHGATRYAMRQFLRAAGVPRVEEATTADDAIRILATRTGPSCVLLDWQIPGGGGEPVLRFIRGNRLPVHVLVVTVTYGRDRDVIAACKPDAILPKPINVADVLEALRGCGARFGLPGAA